MRFFVENNMLYLQIYKRNPVAVMPFDNANPPDHDEVFRKLEVSIDREYAAAVADAFRSALLGTSTDIHPE